MSDFTIKGPDGNKLDPSKRVRYSTGLVLGVDEFEQEQLFFLERDRLHQRGLHGYGTVCGLGVGAKDGKVTVQPGLAVDVFGRNVRVDVEQCGDVDAWQAQQNPKPATVYVSLCYRECDTDSVPVPGAPCRTEDEAMAPSRIASGFEIRFSATPPAQDYEDAVRAFGAVLAGLRASASNGKPLGGDAFAADFRKAYETAVSAQGKVPGRAGKRVLVDWIATAKELDEDALIAKALGGKAPDAKSVNVARWVVPPSEFDALMAIALDLWLSDFKPALALAGKVCAHLAEDETEGCVLLATLTKAAGAWAVDDVDRPMLLATRTLQELLLRRDSLPIDHGDLEGLADDDHKHYLLINGSRKMTGNLQFAAVNNQPARQIFGLRHAAAAGEVLLHGAAAGGDLAGTYPDPDVVAIVNRKVEGADAAPEGSTMVLTGNDPAQQTWQVRPLVLNDLGDCNVAGAANGKLLGYNGTQWVPVNKPSTQLPPGNRAYDVLTWTEQKWQSRVLRHVALADIRMLQNRAEFLEFEVWFHLDLPRNDAEIRSLKSEMFKVLFETNDPDWLAESPRVEVGTWNPPQRNVYRVRAERPKDPGTGELVRGYWVRFLFDTDAVPVRYQGGTLRLIEWGEKSGLIFEGYEAERRSITQFVRAMDCCRQGDQPEFDLPPPEPPPEDPPPKEPPPEDPPPPKLPPVEERVVTDPPVVKQPVGGVSDGGKPIGGLELDPTPVVPPAKTPPGEVLVDPTPDIEAKPIDVAVVETGLTPAELKAGAGLVAGGGAVEPVAPAVEPVAEPVKETPVKATPVKAAATVKPAIAAETPTPSPATAKAPLGEVSAVAPETTTKTTTKTPAKATTKSVAGAAAIPAADIDAAATPTTTTKTATEVPAKAATTKTPKTPKKT